MISVIVPTYNNSLILDKSLGSWNAMDDEQNFEILVIDNNSSDNTADIVHKFEEQHDFIHYFKEDAPGATNARHTGVRAAKGDILVFADDDGLYNPELISSVKKAFAEMPEIEALACKIELQWDEKEPDWIAPYAFMLGQLDYGPEMKSGYDLYFNSGLFAIKKSTFEELHGFNPDLVGGKLIGDGDTGLVIKMHEAHKLIGWTPFAVMKHMQKVSKHGSEKGVALHFYNVGVGDSYALFRKNDFRFTPPVIKYILKSVALRAKKRLQYYVLRKRDRKIYFSLNQRKGQVQFFTNLFSKDIRKAVLVKDVY